MIDMHTHVLPNIDDGSRNMEETVKLLEEAYQAGFTEICTTSHYVEGMYEVDKQKRQQLIDEIQKRLEQKGIDLTLYIGAEAYISSDLVNQVKEGVVPTINHSRYLLFELPLDRNIDNHYVETIIFEMLAMKLVPILAHPERYFYFQEEPNKVFDLIEKGVLFQMNYGSIIGIYGRKAKKTAIKFLKHHMIHFLGTDTHRAGTIYTKMETIQKELEKVLKQGELEELTKINPMHVIKDEKVQIKEPSRI